MVTNPFLFCCTGNHVPNQIADRNLMHKKVENFWNSIYVYSSFLSKAVVYLLYLYILLSPDAERPPAQTLARTGALYEISDLREIYGAGT